MAIDVPHKKSVNSQMKHAGIQSCIHILQGSSIPKWHPLDPLNKILVFAKWQMNMKFKKLLS